jgi:G3E family GTPase
VLEQLLRDQHGFKLGVIVNDLASVNVDANVLRDAIQSSGTKSVSLENGCVCCTASDDLKESVQNILRDAGSNTLDAIVVELSGVAEPSRVKQALEAPTETKLLQEGKALSVRTVTVVDSPAFATDYFNIQTAHHHHAHSDSGECDERFGTLLAEQVESADLLLLNKADVATEEELLQTQAMVKSLNEAATVRTTEYGKVKVDEFLAVELKAGVENIHNQDVAASPDKAPETVKSCCAAKTCSSTNKESTKACGSKNESTAPSRAEQRFGITSFVYTTERMMSRVKLLDQLNKWQQAREQLGNKLNLEGLSDDSSHISKPAEQVGAKRTDCDSPLAPILRSKGILLMDANPEVGFYWSHAGKSVSFSVYGRWPENISTEQGGFGARRTELVFIGAGYDEASIRDLLDSCLLSDADLKFFKESFGQGQSHSHTH